MNDKTWSNAVPRAFYKCKHCEKHNLAEDLRFWEPRITPERRGYDLDPGFYCRICIEYVWPPGWAMPADSPDDFGPTLAELQVRSLYEWKIDTGRRTARIRVNPLNTRPINPKGDSDGTDV